MATRVILYEDVTASVRFDENGPRG